MKTELNNRWQPMTLREVVGIFMLPQKKPPDQKDRKSSGSQCRKGWWSYFS